MGHHDWNTEAPLQRLELPTPEPRDREVRVRVHAVGVNPVDWKMRKSGPLRLAARLVGPKPPVVLGVDFAGIIDAVGSGVRERKVGDRVVGGTNFSRGQRGSYADTVVVREDQVCPLPDEVGFDVAATLPVPGVTARAALLEVGGLRRFPAEERRVLVLGASGAVGQITVQVAKAEGAKVAGVCSTRNVDLVTSLGADAVIDYRTGDALAQATSHGPYHVIVDCVGTYAFGRIRSLLASRGRHVMVAGDSPLAMFQVLVPPFSSRPILGKPSATSLAPLVDAVASGTLRVAIEKRLPLEQAEEAHRLSQTGRLTGNLVLVPEGA